MSIELKIKAKHLSAEAAIIRHEELKLKRQIEWKKQHVEEFDKLLAEFQSLNQHRRYDVRNENRATYLARAYIAQVPYNTVETFRKEENEHKFQHIVLPRVVAMVKKYYNANFDRTHIQAWVEKS